MVETRSSRILGVRSRPNTNPIPSLDTTLISKKKRKQNANTPTKASEKKKRVEDVKLDAQAMEDAVAIFDEQVEKLNEDTSTNAKMVEETTMGIEEVVDEPETTESESDDEVTISNEQESEPSIIESDSEGSNKQKRMVHFNDKGQPIGEGSASFSTDLGSMMRKHCPISYEQWRDVPDQTKNKIWKLVTDNYIVPAQYKGSILQKIRTSWRNFKCTIRSKHYDKYDTDEERRRDRPRGVKQGDWNIFVENQSKPIAQALRKAGKFARQAMKTPHTSGRRGAARTAEALKKGNPLATVTRTDLYLALHSRKDGSCPTPEVTDKVERIKAIAQQDPSSVNLDVDHDPVRQVCGPDKSAVRGMGAGVSKTALLHTAPVIAQLQQERRSRLSAEEQIANLKEQVDQLQQERRLQLSEEDQIADLKMQLDQLQQERSLCYSSEQQIADLKEQMVSQREHITAQGLMIADTRELMLRLCS